MGTTKCGSFVCRNARYGAVGRSQSLRPRACTLQIIFRRTTMYATANALASSPIRGTAEPKIALTIVKVWIVLGGLAIVSSPALRGSDPRLGWLPFWLVAVPLVEWLFLQRYAVAGASRRRFAAWRRSRSTQRRVAVRRSKKLRSTRWRAQSRTRALLTRVGQSLMPRRLRSSRRRNSSMIRRYRSSPR